MRILLLTDFPPAKQHTGGLVLDQLCRFLPRDALFCYWLKSPGLQIQASDAILDEHTAVETKPSEWQTSTLPGCFKEIESFFQEWYRRTTTAPQIAERVHQYVQENEISAVWAVLQGQTLIRVSRCLALKGTVPIHTMVWDPVSWLLEEYRHDPWTTRIVHSDFEELMKKAASCATASEAMSEEFTARFGVKTSTVIASLPADYARKAATEPRNAGSLTIALAGQIYAREEFRRLISVLDNWQWELNGKKIELRVFGLRAPEIRRKRLIYEGWLPTEQLLTELSLRTDLLFCPYPFHERYAECSRLSFPSKLVTYFASGRPVLFHGPDWSSPAKYLRKHQCGFVASFPTEDSLAEQLKSALTEPHLYGTTASNARSAFEQDFVLERMKANFFQFLSLSEEELHAPLPVPHITIPVGR